MIKKDKNIISVSFREEAIRLAHMKMSGASYEVVNILRRDIRGITDEEIPKIVKSAINDFNVKKPKGFCVVPSSLATTKNIEIPSVNPEEIKSIINLQAGRHTPYSRDEIIIDYIPIAVFQRNYTKVLLVIINRTVLKRQLGILENAGLRVEKVLFGPETTARFYAKAFTPAQADASIGIIDVDYLFTDFLIESKGVLVTCRNIPIGMSHLTAEGQGGRDRFLIELKKTVEAYQAEDIAALPESYLLTSDHQRIKDIHPPLQEFLKTTVKIVPFLDNLKVSQAVRKAASEMADESLLEVLSAVPAQSEAIVDLLPDELKLQRSIEQQGREVVKSAIFAVLILGIICILFVMKIYFRTTFLNKLKRSHETTGEEAKTLEAVSEKTRIVKDHLNSRLVSLDTINELYRIIPDEIYLNNIVLDEKGAITIQGVSESMSRVFSLVGALENSPLFKNVKTNSTTAKKERGKDVAAFEIVFRLESAKDETEEEAATNAQNALNAKNAAEADKEKKP